MARFVAKAAARFHVAVDEDYDPEVTALRHRYQREEAARAEECGARGGAKDPPWYDEDVHYPVLVTLALRDDDVGRRSEPHVDVIT
jgi:hypothetical protein